eukprot:scaffold57546_cov122-Phaeocystis_antarctica.AAC.1
MPLATPLPPGGSTPVASRASRASSRASRSRSSAAVSPASPVMGAGATPGEMSVPGSRLCLCGAPRACPGCSALYASATDI